MRLGRPVANLQFDSFAYDPAVNGSFSPAHLVADCEMRRVGWIVLTGEQAQGTASNSFELQRRVVRIRTVIAKKIREELQIFRAAPPHAKNAEELRFLLSRGSLVEKQWRYCRWAFALRGSEIVPVRRSFSRVGKSRCILIDNEPMGRGPALLECDLIRPIHVFHTLPLPAQAFSPLHILGAELHAAIIATAIAASEIHRRAFFQKRQAGGRGEYSSLGGWVIGIAAHAVACATASAPTDERFDPFGSTTWDAGGCKKRHPSHIR